MQNNPQTKKIIIIINVFIFSVIGISAIFMFINSKKAAEQEYITNEHFEKHGTGDITSFENRYQFDYSIGQKATNIALVNLAKIFEVENEISSAPNQNNQYQIIATLKETSLRNNSTDEYYSYFAKFDLSDGRSYDVNVTTDITYGNEYIITTAKRIDNNKNNSFIYINTSKKSTEAKHISWATKKFKLNTPTTFTDQL